MPATLESPPSTKPEGVTIIDSGPPKPPPAPTTTIKVSQMPGPNEPFVPAKPGSAKARMQNDLRKKAGLEQKPETPPAKPASAETEAQTPPETTEVGSKSPEPASTPAAEPKTTPEGQKPPTEQAGKDKKANPWKLVDEWKGRATNLEKELVELKKQVTPETERKAYEDRVSKSETRLKELEDEIRYHNYEKSTEFKTQHEAPYEDAFRRALTDLSEVTVQDPATGQPRAFSADDLAKFAFSSFVQAKEAAAKEFPDFADDIMSARKEIRALWDKRQAALKEWKEKGSVREKEQQTTAETQAKEVSGHIKATWDKVNAQALEDPANGHFFKPKEGDEEWNQRLSKGFELVDRAYSENPADPRLTTEQRASVIKRHAAVRNRAASWGAVKNEAVKYKTMYEEVMAKLKSFQESTPPAGGSAPNGQPAQTGSAMDRMKADLRKYAHIS